MDSHAIEKSKTGKVSSIDISKIIAFISFLGGSLILLTYLISGVKSLLGIGLMYFFAVVVLNVFYFVILFLRILFYKSQRQKALLSIGILLINVPICFMYIKVAMLTQSFNYVD